MKREAVEGFYYVVKNLFETHPNFEYLLKGHNMTHENYMAFVEWIKQYPIKEGSE